MNAYARPTSLDAALALLGEGPRQILAGGTDLYPAAGQRLAGPVLDLAGIADLRGISLSQQGGLRIGACTPWTEIAETALPPACRALQQAARQVGGRQIQNLGTLGGNLCNASPAADGVPPLLALEAMVELAGPSGRRDLPLADFIVGPRQTARSAQELLIAIRIPPEGLRGTSAFLKLGARAYLVISIAMVAVRVVMQGDRIGSASLAVGACAATARRLPGVEAAIAGMSVEQAAAEVTEALVSPGLSPIDDVRASAAYRQRAAAELLRRALREAVA